MMVISLDKGPARLAQLSQGYDEPAVAKMIVNDIKSVRFTHVPSPSTDFVRKHGNPTTEWLQVLNDYEMDAHIFS